MSKLRTMVAQWATGRETDWFVPSFPCFFPVRLKVFPVPNSVIHMQFNFKGKVGKSHSKYPIIFDFWNQGIKSTQNSLYL